MKTTKHIKILAQKLHTQDSARSNYPQGVESFAEDLEHIKRALLNGTFYVKVDSVASSGMSRVLILGYIRNNKFIRIWHPLILNLAGCNKDGRIGGCGMDMCFHAQYTLFHNLHTNYKQARYQKRMARYNSI